MADQLLSLLDITARRGTDQAVGLVEEVTTYAPELEKIMGRPIPGTSYNARVRSAYTTKAAFRKANQGVDIGSSTYEQKRFETFFFDAELEVDEAAARAEEQQGDSLASLQADEAIGAMRAKAILFGQQFYRGTAVDANGFPGMIDFLNTQLNTPDPRNPGNNMNQVVDAQGSGTGERVWFVWMHQQGVHFLFGGNQGIDIKPWNLQQVLDSSSKKYMAWVSNLTGFIGLSCAHAAAVGCVKNITSANPWTDALSAKLLALFPVGVRPNLIFATPRARSYLQQSRTVTLFGEGGSRPNQPAIAPIPTEYDGIPIIPTDSIALEAHS